MDTKDNEEQCTSRPPLTLASLAGQLLSNHLALLAIELEEARRFYWHSLILLALCLGGGILFFILLSVFIIVEFWTTDYRMLAILTLVGISFLTALGSGVGLICFWKKTVLFSATREELRKDQAVFDDQ